MTQPVHSERIYLLGKGTSSAKTGPAVQTGPVVYWMSRDQRTRDNWALLHALQLAQEHNQALGVLFCLVPQYLGAGRRAYEFMLAGLRQVEAELAGRRIPFFLQVGDPVRRIPAFVEDNGVGVLVCDFSPLKLVRMATDGGS